MRRGDVRKGRQCLRPEVCRTYNFGERGSSGGQFYYRYLVPIKLNTADVPWHKKVCQRISDEKCSSTTLKPPIVGTLSNRKAQIELMIYNPA